MTIIFYKNKFIIVWEYWGGGMQGKDKNQNRTKKLYLLSQRKKELAEDSSIRENLVSKGKKPKC